VITFFLLCRSVYELQTVFSPECRPHIKVTRRLVPAKCWHLPASSHGVATANSNIDALTAVTSGSLSLLKDQLN
jgi:hypothetical protein